MDGQSYYTSTEYGFSVGLSQYFGDLNDSYGLKTLNPVYGITLKKHLNQFISMKIIGNMTHVGYSDAYNSNLYEKMRNLSFESNIVEGILQAEFNFFRFATGDPYYRFTPYLTGGIGAFYYKPYTFYNGSQYDLQPLGTEGQNAGYGRKYDQYALCFPIGIGVKFWLLGGLNISLEIADRLTSTDYLDDVSNTYIGVNNFPANSVASKIQDRSLEINGNKTALGRPSKQRGNSSTNDQYMVGVLSLSWHFKTYKCPANLNDDMIRVRRR